MHKITYCFILLHLLTSHVLVAEELQDPQDTIPSAAAHGLEFLAPKDRFVVRLELRTNSYNKLFDKQGNLQDLGTPLNQVNLDSTVFPPLVPFGPGATLGLTHMETEVTAKQYEITAGYGLSDTITVGAIIPFGSVTTHANFSVTGGTIGFNPAFDPSLPVGGANIPLLPVGVGGTAPLGTAGVQSLLSNPLFGYNYAPLATSTWSGIGDPTIGIIWKAYSNTHSTLLLSTGVRIGLAKEANPDNLLEVPLSDGTTDLRLRMEYYYDLGYDFDLKLQVEHDIQFKDSITKRIAPAGSLLAPFTSKEKLDRDMGDYWEYDIGVGKVISDWRVGLTWHRYQKAGDTYTSSIGTDTSSLSANTDLYANQWQASLSWSGINAWKQGDFPLPLIVELTMQETYQARNFPKVRDIYLRVTSFF